MEQGLLDKIPRDSGADSVDGLLKGSAGLNNYGGTAKIMDKNNTRPPLSPDYFIDARVAVEW